MSDAATTIPTARPNPKPIFISYRRSEADDHAGRLVDRLHHWFDAEALFYDKQRNSIDMGDSFPAEIEAALDLHKSVLAIHRRVLGEKHLDTIISAWNLFTNAFQLQDTAAAKEVFETFLLPLLHANPAALPASSQTIRQHMLDKREGFESFTSIPFPYPTVQP